MWHALSFVTFSANLELEGIFAYFSIKQKENSVFVIFNKKYFVYIQQAYSACIHEESFE